MTFPPHIRKLMAELDERLRIEGALSAPPPVRLPFNGTLSEDERRMAEQFAFDGLASWQ